MSELRIQTYSVSVTKRLAEGGFGFVELVHDGRSRKDFALKRCGIMQAESLEIVKKEVSILNKFAGPYVVKLHAYEIAKINGKSEARLLLEFCNGGTLLDLLRSQKDQPMPQSDIFRIFGQTLLALKPMHEDPTPVTHRDLKLENILFGPDRNVRLCDFGSCVIGPVYIDNPAARAAEEEKISKETTQMYRSPELVDIHMRDVLTVKSDIWALGCILYTLCFLKHPFQDAGSLGILNENINIPTSKSVREESRILISRMLDFDAEARPTVAQLLESVTALMKNQPLPPYSLTDEAVQIKALRQQRAADKKAQKHKKTTYTSPLPARKVPVKLDAQSVAAKRLAAKKGIGVAVLESSVQPTTYNSSNNTAFDSFSPSSIASFGGSSDAPPANTFSTTSKANTNFDASSWNTSAFATTIAPTTTTSSSSSSSSSISTGTDDPFSNFSATAAVDFGLVSPSNKTVASIASPDASSAFGKFEDTFPTSAFSSFSPSSGNDKFTSSNDGFSNFSSENSNKFSDAFDFNSISNFDFGAVSVTSSASHNNNNNNNNNNNSNNNNNINSSSNIQKNVGNDGNNFAVCSNSFNPFDSPTVSPVKPADNAPLSFNTLVMTSPTVSSTSAADTSNIIINKTDLTVTYYEPSGRKVTDEITRETLAQLQDLLTNSGAEKGQRHLVNLSNLSPSTTRAAVSGNTHVSNNSNSVSSGSSINNNRRASGKFDQVKSYSSPPLANLYNNAPYNNNTPIYGSTSEVGTTNSANSNTNSNSRRSSIGSSSSSTSFDPFSVFGNILG